MNVPLYGSLGLAVVQRRFFCFAVAGTHRIQPITRDPVLYNSGVIDYFGRGYFDEVLRHYSILKWRKNGINGSLITYCLRSCSELGRLEFGKGIHVDALKLGLNSNRFLGSSLIVFYSRWGQIDAAYKVFEEISERDVVVYTSIITGYAQLGDYKAFEIAKCLHVDQILPNRVTLVSLLQAASCLEAVKEGNSVHGYALRRDIGSSNEVFETSLLDMYIKCGVPELAMVIFNRMSCRTSSTWNVLIAGYLRLGKPFAALSHFVSMVQENITPDLITLSNGLLCCADLNSFLVGRSIHGYAIRQGFELDMVWKTALISMYCKSKNLVRAKYLFDGMSGRDVICFNVILMGFVENGCIHEAMEIFMSMLESRIRPNECTILALLSVFSDAIDSKKAMASHGFVVRHRFESSTEVANQVIYTYANSNNICYAERVFHSMMHKDLISWTSMIYCYVRNGCAKDAFDLFILMRSEKLRPDSVTLLHLCQAVVQLGCLSLLKEIHCYFYRVFENEKGPSSMINSLISTYAKCGELEMARNIFEHAEELSMASWNAMVAAYGTHGYCREALDLFAVMLKQKMAPDATTFTSLLSSCSHSGLVDEGLRIFKIMIENYAIPPCHEHYYCLIDLLGRAGKLEDAAEFVEHLPPGESIDGLQCVLSACRIHGNIGLGKVMGRKLLSLEPVNYSVYASVSNLCAEDEKWDLVTTLRDFVNRRSMKITPGFSIV